MDSSNSSKSYRVRDFLPSIRPSFLSLMLVFACGCLWMKNETTNDRLVALENRVNMFLKEDRVKSGSIENHERTTLKPTEESVELILKKIRSSVASNFDYNSVFACGCLWMKNETTNDRLIALENRMNMFPLENRVKSSLTENLDRTTLKPTEESVELLLKKIQTPVANNFDYNSVKNVPKASSTSLRSRNRRQVFNNTSATITIHDVRKEITKQFEQLMPIKYCKSSDKVCPAGPPGYPGPAGAKGPRGRRGQKGTKGKKGTQGSIGPPGKSGKTGMAGPTGPRGEKGDKGEPGPIGMPGPPGTPGKSISAPRVMLSPAEQSQNEGGNTAFYCTVGGNPSPSVEWRFKGRKLLSGAKYLIKEGELTVKNLNYSDAGRYTCAATNILGSSEASSNLSVRGLPIFTKVPPSFATPVQFSAFRVVCQAEGFPPPMLNWTRSGMPLPVGKTEVKDGTLTIKDLSFADNGLYDCVATNSMGTKKTRINVVVQRAPGLGHSVIVGNNKNFVTTLKNWLSPVEQQDHSDWKRCWRASVDGWASTTFHAKCDGKGPTVTIIRVGGKYIFGGYTSLSWGSSSGYQYDSKAFLFSLVNKPGWAPLKLPQTGKYSSRRAYSIYSYSSYGPTFGGGYDIQVSNQASSNSGSYTNLGHTYSPPSGHSYGDIFAQTFLAGGSDHYFTPDEVETFYETT